MMTMMLKDDDEKSRSCNFIFWQHNQVLDFVLEEQQQQQ